MQQHSKSGAKTLILYDGVCGLCNRVIRFVLRRDRDDRFRFAPQESRLGQELQERYGIRGAETICVVLDFESPKARVLAKSEAALEIAESLGGVWKVAGVLRLLPRGSRDAVYDLIARNRYRIFGKLDACPVPDPSVRNKFLED